MIKVFNQYYVVYPDGLYVVPKEREHAYERVWKMVDYDRKEASRVLKEVFRSAYEKMRKDGEFKRYE